MKGKAKCINTGKDEEGNLRFDVPCIRLDDDNLIIFTLEDEKKLGMFYSNHPLTLDEEKDHILSVGDFRVADYKIEEYRPCYFNGSYKSLKTKFNHKVNTVNR